jgi:hypothetical protein
MVACWLFSEATTYYLLVKILFYCYLTYYFVVIPCGPVLNTFLVHDFNFVVKWGFVIFDGTAPCYYRCRLCFDAGQVLVVLNFQFVFVLLLYCSCRTKLTKINRLNRFHKILMKLTNSKVWFGK